jgi:hypothetical protein
MTLAEILAEIKRYYPRAATWTDAEIVNIINDEQREIFRQLQLKDVYEFETVANQWSYSLPTNCEIEFLEYVGLTKDAVITSKSSFQEYTYADLNENMSGYKYFDALNKLIGIYPVPDATGYNARLIFKKRPALMVSTSTSVKPDLKEDYHRIFVYGPIAEIAGAGSNPDIVTANNYINKYNNLLKDILLAKYNNKKHPKKVKDWSR